MRSLKFIVYLTTLAVVVYTLMTQMGVIFPILFFSLLTCQALLLYMVYRILTDDYQTQRTFEDWYEDKDVRQKKA